jgi:hypothetical protein
MPGQTPTFLEIHIEGLIVSNDWNRRTHNCRSDDMALGAKRAEKSGRDAAGRLTNGNRDTENAADRPPASSHAQASAAAMIRAWTNA